MHTPKRSPALGSRRSARRALAWLLVCLAAGGCAFVKGRPDTVPPVGALYEDGERLLLAGRHEQARDAFQRLVERHPESDLAPVARFLVGETYYRAKEYEKAAPEFEAFVTLYPGHMVADLGQYRLARSYFDQMPSLERDQAITAKAMAEFQKLIRLYPESRYAPDAIVKIETCRGRLAEKELWVADFYSRRGNLDAAIQRYDAILKEYPRSAAAPQALYQKADALIRLGRTDEGAAILKRLVDQYPQSDWSRRARERQTSRSRS